MEEEKKFTIYLHRCPNGKCYVGMTSQSMNQRWRNGLGYKNNKDFYPDIEKYGWENIEHIILEEGLSRRDACAKINKMFNLNLEVDFRTNIKTIQLIQEIFRR